MKNQIVQSGPASNPLSPRERAGVRAVANRTHHKRKKTDLKSGPNPLPRGEGTGKSILAVILILFALALPACNSQSTITNNPNWTYAHDGVVRGDASHKQLALIFTGGDKGEGSQHILDTLKDKHVKTSFFVTGGYVAQPGYDQYLKRMVDEGHYLGPHSHGHLLYAPWEDRSQSLVTEQVFKDDLQQNIDELRTFGAMPKGKPIYFIPPYEYYNARHAQWAREMNCLLFNFTPGTRSNRDWAPEGHKSFVPSTKILEDILTYEANTQDGLNGHLLLLHLGGERQDKMYLLLGELIDELHKRGYELVRVDELLCGS